MKPTISFAVTACDEALDLDVLLSQLLDPMPTVIDFRHGDQLVILLDADRVTPEVKAVVRRHTDKWPEHLHSGRIVVEEFPLKRNFAAFKNQLKAYCSGDYIFQIDADERLGEGLAESIHELLQHNHDADLIFLPRINIVFGLTDDYVHQQGWRTSEMPFPIARREDGGYFPVVNWPDRQARLFRNSPDIKWRNPVHEVIVGHKTFLDMASNIRGYEPEEQQRWSLIHIKSMARQIKQNEMYQKMTYDMYDRGRI